MVRLTIQRSILLLALTSLTAAGCASDQKRTKKGALGGAVVGGVIGAATGGTKGAAIGAATGGAAGAGIGAYLDRRAKELSKVVETQKTDDGLMVTLENKLLFGFDETTLQPQAKQTLDKMAEILAKYPGDRLRVAGFTDAVGSANYNQKLSKNRADVVSEYLQAAGVDASRISAVGLGEAQAEGPSDQPNQNDRKVEIYIDVQDPRQSGS